MPHPNIEIIYTGWESSLKAGEGKKSFAHFKTIVEENNIDAIINPTNKYLTDFPGETSPIYRAAGEQLNEMCKKLIPVEAKAIFTDAYNLNVKKIIHLIGPLITDENRLQQYESAFFACIDMAEKHNLRTLALPVIGYSPYEIYTHDIAKSTIPGLRKLFEKGCKIERIIFISISDYLCNLYEMMLNLKEENIPVFVEFAKERREKNMKLRDNLVKSIDKLDKANRKIQKYNELLIQQKEEISAQNDLLHEQKEEITVQNEQLIYKNEEIALQHDKIKRQKEHITDSINHALRIQKAILPDLNILNEAFDDNFVLYRPCSIVSGDFYWFRRMDNKMVVIAADCTGHGVSGAFMSVLGVSLLNEIVTEKKIQKTDEMLNRLRDGVKKSLQQTGKLGEPQNGMDIAACIIDLENKKVQFSGAYNPLFIIRNNELIKINANRMPIGVYPKDHIPFDEKVTQLQNNDALYIFSDGYVSQFGSENNEKFKTRRFRNMLLKINEKPMAEQKFILDKTLDDWRGTIPQIDDVLVIGFRIP